MKITNPYPPNNPDACRIQANIPPDVFNRWFRGYFAGDHGVRQAILNTLFSALDRAVTTQLNLAPTYDIGNESAIAAVLARINFNPAPVVDPGTPQRSPQPRTPKGHVPRGPTKVRPGNKKASVFPADANRAA